MLKRGFDWIASFLTLLVLSPLLLILYVLAGIDTYSSGLFLQQRVGQDGCLFTIFKLRTMHIKTKKISKFGALLRRSKLDELPQLINILKGEMSFVGPRPDEEGYYDTLEGEARKVLELKPGLTSEAALKYWNEESLLAQQEDPVFWNNTVLFPDKVAMNLDYYYNRSFMGDLKILWKTFRRLFI